MWLKLASNDFVFTCFFTYIWCLIIIYFGFAYKYVTTSTMLKWAHYGEYWVSDSCCVPAGRGWPPLVCVGSPAGLFPLSPGGTARPGSGPSHRPPAVCADWTPPPPAASYCAPAARGFGSGSSQTTASPSAVCSPPPAASSATPPARTETAAHPPAPEEGWPQD